MQSEFEFIEKIRRQALSSSTRVGIGDDCAVLPKDSKTDLVITSDLLVEDIDFKLDWTIPEFLGHKALAVSLSDVAAMGAKPAWAMLSIGVPKKIWATNFLEKFYEGWFALAKKFNVELIGGDVSRTPDKIVIDSIVAGEIKKNKAILRSTAKSGDLIFVTGKLGGAAAGLKFLESGEIYEEGSKSDVQKLLLRQIKPKPKVEVGRVLAEKNLATAMIDLSDGLSSDLVHLCHESKVGAKIFADMIPVDKNLKKYLFLSGKISVLNKKKYFISEELNFALNGGEDFELLFTADRKKILQVKKELKNFPFSQIGEINANAGIIDLVDNSESLILHPKGFRHF